MAKELPARDRDRARHRDRYLVEARKRLARQEQAIAHLAASGGNTTLAEKRLAALRRSLDAILERRRGGAECQGNTPSSEAPGQLGLAGREAQPGSETP